MWIDLDTYLVLLSVKYVRSLESGIFLTVAAFRRLRSYFSVSYEPVALRVYRNIHTVPVQYVRECCTVLATNVAPRARNEKAKRKRKARMLGM